MTQGALGTTSSTHLRPEEQRRARSEASQVAWHGDDWRRAKHAGACCTAVKPIGCRGDALAVAHAFVALILRHHRLALVLVRLRIVAHTDQQVGVGEAAMHRLRSTKPHISPDHTSSTGATAACTRTRFGRRKLRWRRRRHPPQLGLLQRPGMAKVKQVEHTCARAQRGATWSDRFCRVHTCRHRRAGRRSGRLIRRPRLTIGIHAHRAVSTRAAARPWLVFYCLLRRLRLLMGSTLFVLAFGRELRHAGGLGAAYRRAASRQTSKTKGTRCQTESSQMAIRRDNTEPRRDAGLIVACCATSQLRSQATAAPARKPRRCAAA